MSIHIDEFSVKPLYLETYLNASPIGIATGFVVKRDSCFYLVTNWHVVTCRNPFTGQPLSASGIADPDTLKIWFHGHNLGTWSSHDVSLLDQQKHKLWLEHTNGREVDVVALPLDIPTEAKIYDMDLTLADFDLMLYPSEPVSIIGFPEGLTSGGRLPIWKTGHIASDIEIDWGGRPAFLIDATTKNGMSGAPVIAKRVSIYQTSKGNVVGNAVKFLGTYSGREISASGIEVGFVWKPKVITDILSEH